MRPPPPPHQRHSAALPHEKIQTIMGTGKSISYHSNSYRVPATSQEAVTLPAESHAEQIRHIHATTSHCATPPATLPHVSIVDSPPSCERERTLLRCITRIMDTPSPAMCAPTFRFDWSIEAAEHNWAILAEFDLDITRAITSQANSQLSIGSEFGDVNLLQPLLSYHPLWPRFLVSLLTTGDEFPLTSLPDDQRLHDLERAISRGNHMPAKLKSDAVKTLLLKEVEHGWQLPLPH